MLTVRVAEVKLVPRFLAIIMSVAVFMRSRMHLVDWICCGSRNIPRLSVLKALQGALCKVSILVQVLLQALQCNISMESVSHLTLQSHNFVWTMLKLQLVVPTQYARILQWLFSSEVLPGQAWDSGAQYLCVSTLVRTVWHCTSYEWVSWTWPDVEQAAAFQGTCHKTY